MARKSPEKKSETIKKEKTSLESKSEKNKKNVDLTEFDESEEPEENESVPEENSEDEKAVITTEEEYSGFSIMLSTIDDLYIKFDGNVEVFLNGTGAEEETGYGGAAGGDDRHTYA